MAGHMKDLGKPFETAGNEDDLAHWYAGCIRRGVGRWVASRQRSFHRRRPLLLGVAPMAFYSCTNLNMLAPATSTGFVPSAMATDLTRSWRGLASGSMSQSCAIRSRSGASQGRTGEWTDGLGSGRTTVDDRSAAGPSANLPQDAAFQELLLEHERLACELKLAEQVQHQLLPRSLPARPGYEFFAYYQAAHEVGGDYYDFVPLSENRLGIVLGDVSGKGIAAALIMAKFSGDTRLNLLAEDSAAGAARALNAAVCETGVDERFITLSLMVLHADTGRLQVCSAGHPPRCCVGPMGRSKSWASISGVFQSASCPRRSTSRMMSNSSPAMWRSSIPTV